MEDCLHTHDRCDLSSSSGFTPSRLLKLETRHSEKSISLVLRHECPPGTAYMTLSHCWGNQPATSKLRLSSDTLLILREGISLGTLPKTFRDAFHVIETLNFRYLWIDRLCIFQDSQEDWSRESSTMQDVYRHSSLNISAHAAFDDTDGCFFDRDGSVGRTPWLNINLGTAAIPQLYSVREFIPLTISEEFNEGPITCRGWILQERLLAPRVVHFGRKQLFWECMTSMCSETFPANLLDFSWDPPISSGRRHTWKHILDSNQTFILESDYEGPGRELFLDWDGLVRDFSLTKLTVPSDKLVAIAGLANDMKEKLRQERLLRRIPDDDSLRHFETYLAGIWNATLPMSLLWCVWGDRLPRPKYRAPSWSWASVDGNINPNDFFDYWGEEKQLVSVNHAEVIPLHDETGEVVDGTLNVTAPLAVYGLESSGLDKSQVKIKDLRSPLDLNNRQTLQGDNQYHHHIDFDTADDVFEELYCLPIVSSCFANLGLNVHGLVLKSVGAKFCRVGYFSIEARNKISGEVGTFIEKLPRTVVEII
ncbi:heterokaryon incompatibility protein-domain-containing protein [Phyllosticta citribraziliensis]